MYILFFSSLTMCVCVCSSFHNFSTWGHSPLSGSKWNRIEECTYLYSHGHGYHLSRWNVLADVNKVCGVFSSSHSASTAVKSARNLRMRLRFWGPTRRSVVCHWFELIDIGLISIIQKYWVLGGHQCWGNLETVDDWSDLYYPEVLAWGNWETLLMIGLIYINQKYWRQCWGNWETLLMICPHHTTSLGHCIQASVIKIYVWLYHKQKFTVGTLFFCMTLSQAEWHYFFLSIIY